MKAAQKAFSWNLVVVFLLGILIGVLSFLGGVSIIGLGPSTPIEESPFPCVEPEDDLSITEDTVLCRGVYHITDEGRRGILFIESDDVTLNCNGAVIVLDWPPGNYWGGIMIESQEDIIVKNCNLQGLMYGIYATGQDTANIRLINNVVTDSLICASVGGQFNTFFRNTFSCGANSLSAMGSNSIVKNNSFSFGGMGSIDRGSSDNVTFDGNTFFSSQSAIDWKWNSDVHTYITNNVFLQNYYDIFYPALIWPELLNPMNKTYFRGNVFTSSFIQPMLSELAADKNMIAVGEVVNFNVSLFFANGTVCPDCEVSVEVFPQEEVVYTISENVLEGNFVPTRYGSYSLLIRVEDSDGNAATRKYGFVVGPTRERTVRYYFNQQSPIHGQKIAMVTPDGTSLRLTEEGCIDSYCGGFITSFIDEIPEYPLGVIHDINITIEILSGNIITLARYGNGWGTSYYNQSVTSGYGQWNFTDLEWALDYVRSWYGIAANLIEYPHWNSCNYPSYVDIWYSYPEYPVFKRLSNEYFEVLAATSPVDDINSADIVLKGQGEVEFTVVMQDNIMYTVTMDGESCTGDICSFVQNGNEITISVLMDGEYVFDIQRDVYPYGEI